MWSGAYEKARGIDSAYLVVVLSYRETGRVLSKHPGLVASRDEPRVFLVFDLSVSTVACRKRQK